MFGKLVKIANSHGLRPHRRIVVDPACDIDIGLDDGTVIRRPTKRGSEGWDQALVEMEQRVTHIW